MSIRRGGGKACGCRGGEREGTGRRWLPDSGTVRTVCGVAEGGWRRRCATRAPQLTRGSNGRTERRDVVLALAPCGAELAEMRRMCYS
eukprot:438597-Prorocentrum_minimum.AAC.1